jgi:hypothetical protein
MREDDVLSASPEFRRVLKRSQASYQAHGGIPLEEVERRFGLPPRKGKGSRARRRPKRGYRSAFGSEAGVVQPSRPTTRVL